MPFCVVFAVSALWVLQVVKELNWFTVLQRWHLICTLPLPTASNLLQAAQRSSR
ncbi:hypothetical protein NEIELOOT_02594 [Neisseria elongata subsp. glycolytica ATCC 29315]|uniref:Uncharacterized protein n=1 Tax=Neisseria elongata subsp. glycolytica ATCC 29315 TaxID=546263 RepID=D4DU37_NEIEG|nr:hypothetical protein NEIELOOT_02594 [Neisseria elongata subsp. glycolytica ATCC 29315]